MEYLDLIDKNGCLTGQKEIRKVVHEKGLAHHASGLIIFSKKFGEYNILSQQRSLKKEKNAGLWDISASGHISHGEKPIDSLIREVKEELGIDIKSNDLILLGKFWRNETHKIDFIENELDYIYMVEKNIDINSIQIQKEEVESVKWIKLDEFKKLIMDKKAVYRENVWSEFFNYIKDVDKNN